MEACYGGTDVMERSCAVARGKDTNMTIHHTMHVRVGRSGTNWSKRPYRQKLHREIMLGTWKKLWSSQRRPHTCASKAARRVLKIAVLRHSATFAVL